MPWRDGVTTTIVVKTTFGVDLRGGARFVQPGRPLVLDVVDPDDGELVFPSDFAALKPSCDVLIAGLDVHDRGGPATLVCAGLTKHAPDRARLGGREIFCRNGDPTDPSVEEAWSTGAIQPSRFQAAPPDQRLARAEFPLRISYQRGDVSLATELVGPRLEAALLDPRGSRATILVPLLIDTVLVLPRERQVVLLFRGLVKMPDTDGLAPVLAVTPGSLSSYRHEEVLAWPRARLVLPADARSSNVADDESDDPLARTLRKGENLDPDTDPDGEDTPSTRGSSRVGGETIAMPGMPASPALPFDGRASKPPPRESSRGAPPSTSAGFTVLGPPAASSRSALPFEDDADDDEEEPGAWDGGVGTQAIAVQSFGPAVPFQPPPNASMRETQPVSRASLEHAWSATASAAGLPFSRSASPSRSAPGVVPGGGQEKRPLQSQPEMKAAVTPALPAAPGQAFTTAPILEVPRQALALGFQLGGGDERAGVLKARESDAEAKPTAPPAPPPPVLIGQLIGPPPPPEPARVAPPARLAPLPSVGSAPLPGPSAALAGSPLPVAPFPPKPLSAEASGFSVVAAPARAAVVATGPASPVETKGSGQDDEARFRTIQQAIWKGDRPLAEILSEHGLTELEWRALKRSAMKKPAR